MFAASWSVAVARDGQDSWCWSQDVVGGVKPIAVAERLL